MSIFFIFVIMGLDVCVNKVKPLGDKHPRTVPVEDVLMLEERPWLEDKFGHLAFDRVIEFHDVEFALEKEGYNPEEVVCYSISYGEDVTFSFKDKDDKDFKIVNPPIIEKTKRVLWYEEVGYQRKGANAQFYDDDMWSSDDVVELKVLKEHYDKYFLDSNFQENVIDKFVEGETFVGYW